VMACEPVVEFTSADATADGGGALPAGTAGQYTPSGDK
jgi:hypothetical protein